MRLNIFKFKKPARIYWDTAATTPVDPRVVRAMKPYWTLISGNPASLHSEGVKARFSLEQSRKQIADLLFAQADEIIFTSGGTEADNLAILGVARGLLAKNKIKSPGHIITTKIEHSAVLEACKKLEQEGWRITYLGVSAEGIVDLKMLKESLCSETVLVSIMYANNEIGTIEPIREIAKILREFRKSKNKTEESRLPYFHTDACQAPRFLSLNVEKLGVDLMTLNGSKIYGPKGIGCLYIKRNTFIEPVIYGGGQERNLRSGTENLAGIVGLATALKIASENRETESESLIKVRDYFLEKLKSLDGVQINGGVKERLPNNINVSFTNILGEWIVISLDARGVACSTGSACSINHKDDSHVIISLGYDKDRAESAVRFTLDRASTKKDVDYVFAKIKEIVESSKKIVKE